MLWLYKRLGVHSKTPKGSTAGAQPGTNSLLEFGLGKCKRSGRKSHPEGRMHAQPRDFYTSYRAESLEKASADLSCAELHGILSSGGILQWGRTGHKERTRQSSDQPLCLALSCFYSLKKPLKPPPLLPKAVPKKAADRFWLCWDLCLKPAQTSSQACGKIPNLSEIGFHCQLEDLQPPSSRAWKGTAVRPDNAFVPTWKIPTWSRVGALWPLPRQG